MNFDRIFAPFLLYKYHAPKPIKLVKMTFQYMYDTSSACETVSSTAVSGIYVMETTVAFLSVLRETTFSLAATLPRWR